MKKLCMFLCLLLPLMMFAACGEDDTPPSETHSGNEGIVIDAGEALTIGVNETKQLSALNKANNSKTTVVWTSENPSVVSVDYNGMITGITDGTATITASTPDEKYTASCKVTVSSVLTGISFENSTIDMEKGTEITLYPILTPSNITNVTLAWMTGDNTVATVSNGVVKAVGNGSTSIFVSSSDNKFTAVCTINVTTTVTDVTLAEHILQINKGETAQMVANITPEDVSDPTLTWTSSDPSVVTVADDGTITAVSGGAAIITVSSVNGITDTCNVVVSSPVVGVALDRTELVIGVGEVQQLVATIDPIDANTQDVIWTSSDLSVVTVDATGAIIGLMTGTAEITVTTVDGYLTATCAVTVINAATAITFDAPGGDLELGKTLQLIPILTPVDADAPVLTWTSSNPTIATVDENGIITALALGETVITATATNGVTASYNLHVVELEILIEKIITESILTVKVADTVKLAISVLPANSTENYVITSVDPSTVRVNADGTLTPLKAGVTVVNITSKSGGVTESCVINVNELTAEERAELQAEYDAKAQALLAEHQTNLNSITAKYDEQIANINTIIAKLSISSESEYNTKLADLQRRLADTQRELDAYIEAGDESMIKVTTATRDALQKEIDKLEDEWEAYTLLQESLVSTQATKKSELANEDTRYQNALNNLKAEYAFLF